MLNFTLRPRQNGCHFQTYFKLNLKIWFKFPWHLFLGCQIDNNSSLVKAMAERSTSYCPKQWCPCAVTRLCSSPGLSGLNITIVTICASDFFYSKMGHCDGHLHFNNNPAHYSTPKCVILDKGKNEKWLFVYVSQFVFLKWYLSNRKDTIGIHKGNLFFAIWYSPQQKLRTRVACYVSNLDACAGQSWRQ